MTRIALLGATGSLGSHVAQRALDMRHEVSVFVRSPSRLAPEVARHAQVTQGDLLQSDIPSIAKFIAGHDALVSCAGLVTEGEQFVRLFDRVVSAVESLPPGERPQACWFIGGAAMLDLDASGRCGVDLPKVRSIYWPHRSNYQRLQRSDIAWRMLCPGPMVPGDAIGIARMRVSADGFPVPVPGWTSHLPGALVLPFFAARIPQMIIPYHDAAEFMLQNIAPGGQWDRKRAGIALPVGMRGSKKTWAAQPAQRQGAAAA